MTANNQVAGAASAPGSAELQWQANVPLVTHPLFLKVYAKAGAVTALIMAALLSFLAAVTGNVDAIPAFLMLSAGAALGVLLIGLVGAALVYRNKLALAFRLDARGAAMDMIDGRAKAVAGAAVALGALAGSAGAAGAGLLAASDRYRFIAWKALAGARFHPNYRAITLRNSWRNVMILFCTAENYDAVAALVQAALAAPRAPRRNPVWRLLLHTVLVVIAVLPLFAMAYPIKLDMFAPLFVLCFALASLWLVPPLAYATLLGLAWVGFDLGAQIVRFGLDRTLVDGETGPPLVGAMLGAAYLLWLSLALLRGRIESALAGDEAESDEA